MTKTPANWLDGSLFFKAVAWMLNGLGRFVSGSLPFKLLLANPEGDEAMLRHSRFVVWIENVLNRFPKFLKMPPWTPPAWLQCSAVFSRLLAMSIPAVGLLFVVGATPFLPTMMLAGMLAVVFGLALFRHTFVLQDLTGLALAGFIAITVFYGYLSLAPEYSIFIALLSTVLMSAYFLVRVCFQNPKTLMLAMAVFAAGAAVTALVGYYQVFIGYVNMTWVDRDLFAALQLRVYSTFGNPNVYGAYLLLAIPLTFGLALYAKRAAYKIMAAGAGVMLLIALALTYSRGCYIALAFGLALFVLLVEKRLIVLFAAGLATLPFVLPAGMLARIASIPNLADSSTDFRISIWRASVRILDDFWMAGLGQGIAAYNQVYPFYAFTAVPAPHAHNLFLQVFLETGIVGLLVFVLMLVFFFRCQLTALFQTANPRRKFLIAAMIAGAAGFLVQGMFDHVFYNYSVMLAFFLFMGMANAFAGIREEAP